MSRLLLTRFCSAVLEITVFIGCLTASEFCNAGATACQWIVVVNGNSDRSRTIANHYTHWRDIPPANVIVLSEVPEQVTIDVETFRTKILAPVLNEIERRKLSAHIQGIAYSSDFPTAIDATADLQPDAQRSQYLSPIASINGLTYLYRFVMAKKADSYLALANNFYVERPSGSIFDIALPDAEGQEVVNAIVKAKEEKDYDKLANALDRLVLLQPYNYAVHYAAAEAWSRAGVSHKALDRLQKAISLGWSYADYTLADEAFIALKNERRFQALLRTCPKDEFKWTPSRGFDARNFYGPNGSAGNQPKHGISYLLSICLAVCGDIGNSESEVLQQLKTSILADHSRPDGTIYITDTSDVRTTCRKPGFELATERLKKLDHKFEILPTILPTNKRDVVGVTMGTATFAWAPSQSRFVPGALADNLTSLGGAMDNGYQTKLTEFLRNGAAGASGAVAEPYSIQAKFPLPALHASYASGLTMAEAFYSTTAGPYQLLIAGDPLCQPFSLPPKVRIVGFDESAGIRGNTSIRFQTSRELTESKAANVTIIFDGLPKARVPITANFNISDNGVTEGYHEIRFLFTSDTRITEAWEKKITFGDKDSSGFHLDLPKQISIKELVTDESNERQLTVGIVNLPANTKVTLGHDSEVLGEFEAVDGEIAVPIKKLGRGPVRLHASYTTKSGDVHSPPAIIEVMP